MNLRQKNTTDGSLFSVITFKLFIISCDAMCKSCLWRSLLWKGIIGKGKQVLKISKLYTYNYFL
jgi:hypothetical protein